MTEKMLPWTHYNFEMHNYWHWDLDLCLWLGNSSTIEWISCSRWNKPTKHVKASQKSTASWLFSSTTIALSKKILPTGQTVNKEYYSDILRCLRESIRKKRPELWRNSETLPSLFHQKLSEWRLASTIFDRYSSVWLFLIARLKLPLCGHPFKAIRENMLAAWWLYRKVNITTVLFVS